MPPKEAFYIKDFNSPQNLDNLSPPEQIDFTFNNHIEIIGQKNLIPFTENIKSDNDILVILSNHLSLADAGCISKVTREICELLGPDSEFKGFYMPYAIDLGGKGTALKEYLDLMTEYCNQNNLFLIPILRPEDLKKMIKDIKEKYKDDKEGQEKEMEKLKNLINISKESKIKMEKDIISGNYGLAFFPEGKTKGGRKDELTGKLHGSQKAIPNNFFDCLFDDYYKEKNFRVLCVGIENTNEHYSPIEYKFDNYSPKLKISIGETLDNNDLNRYMDETPSDKAFFHIIKQLPHKLHGAYDKLKEKFIHRVNLN